MPHYFMHGESAGPLIDRDKRLAAMLAKMAPVEKTTASAVSNAVLHKSE